MLALRVTKSYAYLKPFFDRLVLKCDKLVAYQHDDASRVHVHALVVKSQISTDTMKNWIKSINKQVKIEKTDWSFVTKDVDEKFITYMSKGNLAPVCCHGFTDDQILAYKNAWVDKPRTDRKMKLSYVVKETPEQRKLRQEDMLKEIERRYNENELRYQSTRELIGLIYQVVAVENRNVLGRYKVRDYYDTIMAKVHKETWLNQMSILCAFKD